MNGGEKIARLNGATAAIPSQEQSSLSLSVSLDAGTLELLAQRVAELLASEHAPAPPEPWLDVRAAAAHLACPTSRVYSLVAAHRVPHERDGSRLLFKRSALDEWVRAGGGVRP